MKLFTILILVALSLPAEQHSGHIDISGPQVAGVDAAVDAWLTRQLKPDGTPKYEDAQALRNAILQNGYREIIKQQCEFDVTTCPAAIQAEIQDRRAAITNIDTEVELVVKAAISLTPSE